MLALIGSGETSPTMVTVHRYLVGLLGARRPRAILLATPYAFQVNADGVSAKARGYFARSVNLDIRVVPGTARNADPAMAVPMLSLAGSEVAEGAEVRAADWVFAGPGNPPYALAHWRAGDIATALLDRVVTGQGVTILASAAAATAGEFTVPVYEIYKAGAAARWSPGLNLLGLLGLRLAVIPHYNNTEGDGYDTRYCYLGAARLAQMERQLPDDAAILGIDEHTALLLDLAADTAAVRGRGSVTIRRHGTNALLPTGATVTIASLRGLVCGATADGGSADVATADGGTAVWSEGIGAAPVSLPELTARAKSVTDQGQLAEVILELEDAIRQWGTDTDEDQGTEQARAVMRSLIGRLGQAARSGQADIDPANRLRPAVQPLVELRAALREEGRFAAADTIRDALTAAGVSVRDTPEGSVWRPVGER